MCRSSLLQSAELRVLLAPWRALSDEEKAAAIRAAGQYINGCYAPSRPMCIWPGDARAEPRR